MTAIAGHIQPAGRADTGSRWAGEDDSGRGAVEPGGGYDDGGVQEGRGPSGEPIGWVSS